MIDPNKPDALPQVLQLLETLTDRKAKEWNPWAAGDPLPVRYRIPWGFCGEIVIHTAPSLEIHFWGDAAIRAIDTAQPKDPIAWYRFDRDNLSGTELQLFNKVWEAVKF